MAKQLPNTVCNCRQCPYLIEEHVRGQNDPLCHCGLDKNHHLIQYYMINTAISGMCPLPDAEG